MDIVKGGIYRHYKGNKYKVLEVATNSETLEVMVVYKALYGDGAVWVRPIRMWNEPVTYCCETMPRFSYIGTEEA